ncbi:MAG TPA: hypothetical protein VGC42_08185 [Kofleriaceae bacterium]
MGTIDRCEICDLPVLELRGQFELMQPYFAGLDEEPLELIGEVHTKCLVSSEHRERWVRTSVQHFSGVRGYAIVRTERDWTIMRHARLREVLAFHVSGESIDLPARQIKASPVDGGATIPRESDYHMTIDDREIVAELQRELTAAGKVPLAELVDALGIREKLYWPDILQSGVYAFPRQLRGDWSSTSIAGRMQYRQFIPDVVLEAWQTD